MRSPGLQRVEKMDPSVAKHPTQRKERRFEEGPPFGDLVMTSRIGVFVRQGFLGHRRKTAAQRRETPLPGWEFSRAWCAFTRPPKSTLRQAQSRLCGSAAGVRIGTRTLIGRIRLANCDAYLDAKFGDSTIKASLYFCFP
jgi:hypothetical protein